MKTKLPENVDDRLSEMHKGVYPCGEFNPFAFIIFRAALTLSRLANREADFSNFRRWEKEARLLYNDERQAN